MSIFIFYEHLKKGLKGNYLLYSEEPFMLQEAFSQFWSFVKERGMELSCKVFDMEDKPSNSAIREALASPDFFGSKTTNWIIIKNSNLLKNKDIQTLYSEMSINSSYPGTDTKLLLLWKGKVNKNIEELFPGTLFISVELFEKDITKWIYFKAKELGVTLSADAVEYIMETSLSEPGIIFSELQKLKSAGFLNPSMDELRLVMTSHSEYDIRDLFLALKTQDKTKTLCILNSLKEELIQAVGMINKIYSTRPDYKKFLPLLHEMDLRAKISRDYLEPLIIKLFGS